MRSRPILGAFLGIGFGFLAASLHSCTETVTVILDVATVDVSPSNPSVAVGQVRQLSAVPRDAEGNTLSTEGRQVGWSSSNSQIASVDVNGLVSGAFSGDATVTATIDGRSGTATVSVSGPSTETLAGGSVILLIPDGALPFPLQFTATATTSVPFSDLVVAGSTYDIEPSGTTFAVPATLTISYDPANVPADVDESELRLFKVVGSDWTVMDPSSVDIPAQTVSGSVSSLSRFGVRGLSVATVEVSPSSYSLETGGTVQLTATPRAAEGLSLDSRAIHWSTSDDEVATVDGSGLVMATGPGLVTIRATSGGITGTAAVTVTASVASVEVLPSSATMNPDQTLRLTATALDSDGEIIAGKTALWSSSEETVATVDATGLVTAVRVGSATITATIDSKSGSSAITVALGPIVTTNSPLPEGIVGTAYSHILSATGGDGSYTWSVSAGSLPSGLSLGASTGVISGTPTAAGTSTFTVQVASGGQKATKEFFLLVSPSSPVITTLGLPDGTVGAAYSHMLSATGGDGSYIWSLSAGSLPAGLSLGASTGVISGTPTAEGTSTFTVQVASGGKTAAKELSIYVASSTFNCSAQSDIPVTECEALVALYDATNGPGWANSTDWVTYPNPCLWRGVTCSSGSVSQLSLTSNQLTGSIPTELGNLVSLSFLDLQENQLTGSIPPEIGSLVSLSTLELHDNQLTGSMPPELGSLANLQRLALSNNQLTASIPLELGNLTNLRYLYLTANQLTGSIPPELGNLASLEHLYLNSNQLSGPIPAEIGNLADLTYFYLYENPLTGLVPLLVAQRGGLVQAGGGGCLFVAAGDPGLYMPDTQDYRDADLDSDGKICGVTIG